MLTGKRYISVLKRIPSSEKFKRFHSERVHLPKVGLHTRCTRKRVSVTGHVPKNLFFFT